MTKSADTSNLQSSDREVRDEAAAEHASRNNVTWARREWKNSEHDFSAGWQSALEQSPRVKGLVAFVESLTKRTHIADGKVQRTTVAMEALRALAEFRKEEKG